MSMNGTLINHCGATPVTRSYLEIIVSPPPTETWYPVRHQEVLSCVEETLDSSGFRIAKSQLSVSNQQKRFFGVMDITTELADGVTLSIGVRIVLRAWEQGLVGTRLLRPLLDEWRHPSFEEFRHRTAWSMLSAFTHIAKERQRRYPQKAAWEVMQFQTLLTM